MPRQLPPIVTDQGGRINMRHEHERNRVLAIATRIVSGQVANGEVDPEDEVALRKATQEAVRTAVEACRAAEEFICG